MIYMKSILNCNKFVCTYVKKIFCRFLYLKIDFFVKILLLYINIMSAFGVQSYMFFLFHPNLFLCFSHFFEKKWCYV